MNGLMKENREAEERVRQMQEQHKQKKTASERLDDAQKKLQEAEEEYRSARSEFEKKYPSRPAPTIVPIPYPVPVPSAPWRYIPGVDRYPHIIFSSNNSA